MTDGIIFEDSDEDCYPHEDEKPADACSVSERPARSVKVGEFRDATRSGCWWRRQCEVV